VFDVNEDDLVNILDVITIINMIFGTIEISENADINADGIINVLDVMGVINIILGININEQS
jgi:membrane-associated protease RseP (regulator of RpoE activity)